MNPLEDQARTFSELGVNSNFMIPKKLWGSRMDMAVGGQSLKLSGGSFWIFFTRPLSGLLLVLACLLFLSYFFLKRRREIPDKIE